MITNKEVIISVNKTLTRKFIYIVAAITLLAMMIPAMTVPVSAANPPSLSLVLVDPTNTANTLGADGGYNIIGSIVQVTSTQDVAWSTEPSNPTIAQFMTGNTTRVARVQGWYGEVNIQGTNSGNETGVINKKWGLIKSTSITAPGSTYVTWNEAVKAWQAGPVTITDTVMGSFPSGDNVMQGVVLNWFLLPGNVSVNMASEEYLDHPAGAHNGLKYRMEKYVTDNPTHLVKFANGTQLDQNVTGSNGQNTVNLIATGEEAVQIVCVAHYPGDPQIRITPERTSYNFYTTESEVVPQVRWAGEKIVLEKYFGTTYNGKDVCFSLQNGSVGALEGISTNESYGNSAWTTIKAGFASCILVSSDAGVANVVAGLYEANQGASLGNQHFFTVYFLKFESLTIGDVVGKRASHNSGLWNPKSPNPWNTATDSTTQTLNVSQDALVRARVKGWFTSSNPSWRNANYVLASDTSAYQTTNVAGSLLLPAGRWILPDDWATLAGPNWKQSRIHWDIMNTVGGNNVIINGVSVAEFVGAPWYYATYNSYAVPPGKATETANSHGELGNYYKYDAGVQTGPTVGLRSVIGPFSPGLEEMTPQGWLIVGAPTNDSTYRNMHTVVPDGFLDWWDAPMPPAKVIYQIQAGQTVTAPNGHVSNPNQAGYFKAVNKTDIYYTWVTDPILNQADKIKVYTNPFYQEMIPAHEAIPAFINNGGYDWNSFNEGYGPYVFWQFINQNRYLPIVTSTDPSGHPTCAEVYSDNHGEAMIWLNGNWNLDLYKYSANKFSADVEYKAIVGTTKVQATVDYPYSRLHQAFQSNTDTKTWLWGGLILGTDSTHQYGDLGYNNPAVNTNNPLATRMVLAAGAYDVGSITPSDPAAYPNQSAASHDKVVFVWVTDRDGLYNGVLGAKVDWSLTTLSGGGGKISTVSGSGISTYNEITSDISLTGGFLTGTNGVIVGDAGTRQNASSFLRQPTPTEKKLFNKFWGSGYTDPNTHVTQNATSPIVDEEGKALDPNDFRVAAIDLLDNTGSTTYGGVNVTITIWSTDYDVSFSHESTLNSSVTYGTNVYFGAIDPLDDALRAGDANCDGVVNMGDVTAVERMILGYNAVTSNAALSSDGTVDMGTVVKIERTILGLK